MRDFLILPLVVGLVVGAFTVVLPKLFADKLELSYEIDSPTAFLDDPAVREVVQIEVKGKAVSDLISFRVRLWNSGDKPIKELPLQVDFDSKSNNFSILNVRHQTTPAEVFGNIDSLKITPKSRRYKYELLNSGDEDVITFLANGPATLEFNAKAEGLTVKEQKLTTETGPSGKFDPILPAALISAFAALITLVLRQGGGELMEIFSVFFKKKSG